MCVCVGQSLYICLCLIKSSRHFVSASFIFDPFKSPYASFDFWMVWIPFFFFFFNEFLNSFHPDVKKLLRRLERIKDKTRRNEVSVRINQAYIHIYIVIHKQTASLCYNSSDLQDRRNSRSWNRNPADSYANRRFYRTATRKLA